jgi:hypothetical protein
MRANQIKSDATLAELEQVLEAVRRYHGNGQDGLPH